MRIRGRVKLCAAALLLFTSTARAVVFPAPQYMVTDLGSIGSVTDTTTPLDINNAGQVTGVSYSGSQHHAFRWSSGTLTDLGTLGSPYSEGHGINDSGVVVGNSGTAGISSTTHAFRWENGTMTDIGTLGGPYGFAYAINNNGRIVGSSSIASGPSHAAQWDNGTVTDLGTLAGISPATSRALALNAAGIVVGHSDTASGETHAFRYQSGAMSDLGTLPGGTESWARSINDLGQIVGHSTTASTLKGFYVSGAGSLIPLAMLTGDTAGVALGINGSGAIVGDSEPFAYGQGRAVCWSSFNAAPIDLNTLIPVDSNWFLINARAINDSGQIVGTGYHGTASRAYLLTPVPEPIAIAPLIGMVWLMPRRQRKG